MALTIRVQRIDIVDPDGTGPLAADVHTITTSDDPSEATLGMANKSDVRRAVLTRAAFVALIGALKRPNTDTWPDATLPHPVAKAP